MIALGWTLPDARHTGRLPKYNPKRRKTFCIADWKHVCHMTSSAFRERGLWETAGWLDAVAQSTAPRKSDQDRLDASVCLLVALHLAELRDCLMVGNQDTGYMVVPYREDLTCELRTRCEDTGRTPPSEWVRTFRLSTPMPHSQRCCSASKGSHAVLAKNPQ
jgi:hypothetical protein